MGGPADNVNPDGSAFPIDDAQPCGLIRITAGCWAICMTSRSSGEQQAADRGTSPCWLQHEPAVHARSSGLKITFDPTGNCLNWTPVARSVAVG